MAIRIVWAKKPSGLLSNPHEAISELGWKNELSGATGTITRIGLYDWLQKPGAEAYVIDKFGNKVQVKPRTNLHGTKFVQSESDGIPSDNLLKLPSQ